MRLYFDTSVLGALTDREERRRLALTRALLQDVAAGIHVGILSNIVREELAEAPTTVRQAILDELRAIGFEAAAEDAESRELFREYANMRIVPVRYQDDLRHVAVATVVRADALVSWNFRHLVNVKTRRAVHAVNVRLGYPMIEIVSPEEV